MQKRKLLNLNKNNQGGSLKKFLIITGGSSGIGFATAKIFKDDGFEIINLSRSSINLDKAIHIEVDLSTSNWQKIIRIKF